MRKLTIILDQNWCVVGRIRVEYQQWLFIRFTFICIAWTSTEAIGLKNEVMPWPSWLNKLSLSHLQHRKMTLIVTLKLTLTVTLTSRWIGKLLTDKSSAWHHQENHISQWIPTALGVKSFEIMVKWFHQDLNGLIDFDDGHWRRILAQRYWWQRFWWKDFHDWFSIKVL